MLTPAEIRSLVSAASRRLRRNDYSALAEGKRKPELGRGERVLPGVYRLRLPLPWPGVPHGNAWAVSAGDGIVLFDTGIHAPGSLAHLERALAMCGLRWRTCACSCARTRTPTTTARPRRSCERAGCELWMHPNYEHARRWAEDPDAALMRRLEIARQSGVPEEPLRRYAAERGGDHETGIAAIVEPDRALVPGRDRRTPISVPGPCTRRPVTRPRTCVCSNPSGVC